MKKTTITPVDLRAISTDPDICQALMISARRFEYSRKESLVMPEQPWQQAYLLQSGLIRMYYPDRQGREHNKAFFSSGDFFWPLTEQLRQEATGFFIEAMTAATGWYWHYQDLRQAFSKDTDWLQFSLQWQETLLNHKFNREKELLQLSATERYQLFCQHRPELAAALTDIQLASYIGVTPESLSRLKKSLNLTK